MRKAVLTLTLSLSLAVLLFLGCTGAPRPGQETSTTPAALPAAVAGVSPEIEPAGTDAGATAAAAAPAQDPGPPPSPARPGLPPDQLVLEFVDMVDATTGWAIGHPGPERFTSRILRTIDGADTWVDVTPPAAGPFNTAAHFFMGDRGWVALHREHGAPLTLLHTGDGGQTWGQTSLQALGLDVTDLHFVDARHGWMMVYRGAGAGRFSADLWRTRDGGENWQRQLLPVPDDFMAGHLLTYPPRFFSPTDGVLGLRFVTGNGRGLVVYRTRDGGETWSGTTPLRTAGVRPPVVAFADADHGWATDGVRLYATADGGQQWTAITTDVPLTDARQLEFVTGRVGWLLAWDGRDESRSEVWRTADGGRTWTLPAGRWQWDGSRRSERGQLT